MQLAFKVCQKKTQKAEGKTGGMLTGKGAMSCSMINTLLIAAQKTGLELVVVKSVRAVLVGLTITPVLLGSEACETPFFRLCKETPALRTLWAFAVGLTAPLGYCAWECAAGCIFLRVKKSSWKGI